MSRTVTINQALAMQKQPESLNEWLNQSATLKAAYYSVPAFAEKLQGNMPPIEECLVLMGKAATDLHRFKSRGMFIDDGQTMQQLAQLRRESSVAPVSVWQLFNALFVLASAYDAGHIQARSRRVKAAFDTLLSAALVVAISGIESPGDGYEFQ